MLWKARPEDLSRLAEPLSRLANEFAEKIAAESTSTKLSRPAAWIARHHRACRDASGGAGALCGQGVRRPDAPLSGAQLVVFSGLKIDKLDDLEAMIGRGTVTTVFAAGSLAMALQKAAAELDGSAFRYGRGRRSGACRTSPISFPRSAVEQAKRMIEPRRGKRESSSCCRSISSCKMAEWRNDRPARSAVRHRPQDQRAVRDEGRRIHRTAPRSPGGRVSQRRVRHVRRSAVRGRAPKRFMAQLKR